MKRLKTICILLLAMSMVLALCACGDSAEEEATEVSDTFEVVTPEPSDVPEADEEEEEEEEEETEEEAEEEETAGVVKDNSGVTLNQTTPTPAPADAADNTDNSTAADSTTTANNSTVANNSTAADSTATAADNGADLSTDEKISIAEGYLYQNVNLLYSAIGYPDSSAYSEGCMGGEDGQLFYDGFEVQTRVNPDNGDEIIMGVY